MAKLIITSKNDSGHFFNEEVTVAYGKVFSSERPRVCGNTEHPIFITVLFHIDM
jgi:hypothetical protein